VEGATFLIVNRVAAHGSQHNAGEISTLVSASFGKIIIWDGFSDEADHCKTYSKII
jgi:hypothetical protein